MGAVARAVRRGAAPPALTPTHRALSSSSRGDKCKEPTALAHVHAVWHRAATMPIRSDMVVCLARDRLDLAAGPSAPASQAVCSPQCGAYEVRPPCNPKSARGFILCSGAWGSVTHLSKQVVALLVKAVANPSSNGLQI